LTSAPSDLALLCRQFIDLALEREDRVDPAQCFKRKRRGVFLARGRPGKIGQDKEFPPPRRLSASGPVDHRDPQRAIRQGCW
jgi:hypothetical protein